MSSRKKSPARKAVQAFKLKNPKTVFCNKSLPEPDQCRQMCYQLAIQLAEQECQERGEPFDPDTLDRIALETVRLCFKDGPPSPGELAGLHPMMVTVDALEAAQATTGPPFASPSEMKTLFGGTRAGKLVN